ncbi:MAG: endonuclease/exonuclease/phosphatase family protein [Planctomycetota bacterium]
MDRPDDVRNVSTGDSKSTQLLVDDFVLPTLPVVEPIESAFSLMTWNLEWFWDDETRDNFSDLSIEQSAPSRNDWNWKRDSVAAAIAHVRPTVVATQEVEGQRTLWYLTRALERNHSLRYDEFLIKGDDHFTEQDVGLLVTEPASVMATMRGHMTESMRASDQFGSVSKHLITRMTIPVGDQEETIFVVNVHLRARPEREDLRVKQIKSLNAWIDQLVVPEINGIPVHLVVMGDFNTEHPVGNVGADTELGLAISRGTSEPDDDLVDLHQFIDEANRRTHLLDGRQYDRILVSKSLIEDDPDTADLVLSSVRVADELAVRGSRDTELEHWDNGYWNHDVNERDVSDHYPVLAHFQIQ